MVKEHQQKPEQEKNKEHQTTIKQIGGLLHKVIPIVDKSGEILSYALKPLMVEFKPKDVLQVIVGASILAIPLAFTGEAWDLGKELPLNNVLGLGALTIFFIALFVYFNYYNTYLGNHWFSYLKRVLTTYFLSALVVASILTIIQKCPWGVDNLLAIKRIIIITFPASMSATVSDTIK